MEFWDVNFSYIDIENNEEIFVNVPESNSKTIIPADLPAGSIYTIATNPDTSHKGLIRLDLQVIPGSGKFEYTGFNSSNKDELKEAISYIQANLKRISSSVSFKNFDYHLRATDVNSIGNFSGIELAVFISLCSGILDKKTLSQMVVLGSMNIRGAIIGSDNLADSLQIAVDSGEKKVLLPAIDMSQIANVPADILGKFQLVIYSDPIDAVYKALGVG